jgi:hypothetical protein
VTNYLSVPLKGKRCTSNFQFRMRLSCFRKSSVLDQGSSRPASRPYLNSSFPRMKRDSTASKTPTRHCVGTLEVHSKIFRLYRAEKLHYNCIQNKNQGC